MKPSSIAVAVGVLLLLVFGFNYVDSARTDALVAEGRVQVLEAEREELEQEVEDAVQNYESLKDSLGQVQDSLAEVREQAENDVLTSSVSFEENLTILRDSLEDRSSLASVLDTLESNHLKVVEGYETQVASLEWDKQILLTRVESLDSLWVMEQRLNESLRKEITALNQASDAWKRAATPTVFSRLRGAVPYIVVGAGAVLLLR
jgi:chromosome segregation ATPase|tara:strand:- start:275 stop:889 length:615 start_codon:yes stop_codon:yes gene_type:complete